MSTRGVPIVGFLGALRSAACQLLVRLRWHVQVHLPSVRRALSGSLPSPSTAIRGGRRCFAACKLLITAVQFD